LGWRKTGLEINKNWFGVRHKMGFDIHKTLLGLGQSPFLGLENVVSASSSSSSHLIV